MNALPVGAIFERRGGAVLSCATAADDSNNSRANPTGCSFRTVFRRIRTRLRISFLFAFRPFQQTVALYGAVNSLAQVVLKIAAPGIPDFYQGCELWDLSLVDPDNRRPTDFARRRAALAELTRRIEAAPADLAALCAELLEGWPDGLVKLYVTHRALAFRRARAGLFGLGAYLPLSAAGTHAEHVIAFARRDGDGVAVAAVPRLTARLTGFAGRWPLGAATWDRTWISLGDRTLAGSYRDRFTGRLVRTEDLDSGPALAAQALFASFPVALLERADAPR